MSDFVKRTSMFHDGLDEYDDEVQPDVGPARRGVTSEPLLVNCYPNPLLPDNLEHVPRSVVSLERRVGGLNGARASYLERVRSTPGYIERRYKTTPSPSVRSAESEDSTPWRALEALHSARSLTRHLHPVLFKKVTWKRRLLCWTIMAVILATVIGVTAAVTASMVLIAIHKHVAPFHEGCSELVYEGHMLAEYVNSTVLPCPCDYKYEFYGMSRVLYQNVIDAVYRNSSSDAYGYSVVSNVRCVNISMEHATFALHWRRRSAAPSPVKALLLLRQAIRTGDDLYPGFKLLTYTITLEDNKIPSGDS